MGAAIHVLILYMLSLIISLSVSYIVDGVASSQSHHMCFMVMCMVHIFEKLKGK